MKRIAGSLLLACLAVACSQTVDDASGEESEQAITSALHTVTIGWNGEAGREELHTVDPKTMKHTLVAPIAGVKWTSDSYTDTAHGMVYFKATGDDQVWRLFGVDARTGRVLSNPAFPELTYDSATGATHGYNFGGGLHFFPDGRAVTVTWNGDAAREELHTIDPKTMQHALIAPIAGVKWTSNSYTDTAHGMVYIQARGDDEVWHLLGVDAKTGAVVSNPAFPELTYDSATGATHGYNFGGGLHFFPDGRAVAVTWNGDAAREELHTIDPKTMTHKLIAPIAGVKWTSNSYTDTAHGMVYVQARGDDEVWRLFGVDAKTGAVRSKPLIPAFTSDAATGVSHGFNFGAGLHFFR